MMKVFSYYKEFLLFAIISVVYTSCTQTGWSWSGYDCDLGDFLYAAENGTTTHFPGFPLFAMLAYGIIRIPFGDEAFTMALMLSTIPSIITCIAVFYAVRKQTINKWAPFVATATLAGANVFLMQSIIVEVYALTAMVVTLSYVFMIYGRYRLAAIFAGLTLSMHIMAAPAALAMFVINKELRAYWKWSIIIAVLMYAYVVVTSFVRDSLSTIDGSSFGVMQYMIGTLADNTQWWLNLPAWEIPEKIWISLSLFSVAFGLSLIPMFVYFKDYRKSKLLLAMVVIPVIYYFGCVLGLTSVHLMLAVPFLAVAAGLGVSKIKIPPYIIFAGSMVLLLTLPLNYDIGRTLDKHHSAEETYASFGTIEDRSIVVNLCRMKVSDEVVLGSISGREQTMLIMYNDKYNKEMVPLNISRYSEDVDLPGIGNIGEKYRDWINDEYGVVTPYFDNPYETKKEKKYYYWELLEDIVEANPDRNVYYFLVSDEDPFRREITRYETIQASL